MSLIVFLLKLLNFTREMNLVFHIWKHETCYGTEGKSIPGLYEIYKKMPNSRTERGRREDVRGFVEKYAWYNTRIRGGKGGQSHASRAGILSGITSSHLDHRCTCNCSKQGCTRPCVIPGEHQARQRGSKVSGLGARVHTAVLLRHKHQLQEIQT